MSEHDGERELVLGNKQLLTIFFVAAILCGVFFAMGYVVGGNSAKSGAAAATGGTDTTAPVTEGKREEPQAPPMTDTAATMPSTSDAGASVPAPEPRVADNPAAAGAQPSPSSLPQPTVPATTTATSKPAAPEAGAIFISEPEKGASYIQVIATPRPHADDMVRLFRQAGLPAIMAQSSKPDLFAVMIGPYRSALSLKEAKDKLKGLGFDGITVKKQ